MRLDVRFASKWFVGWLAKLFCQHKKVGISVLHTDGKRYLVPCTDCGKNILIKN